MQGLWQCRSPPAAIPSASFSQVGPGRRRRAETARGDGAAGRLQAQARQVGPHLWSLLFSPLMLFGRRLLWGKAKAPRPFRQRHFGFGFRRDLQRRGAAVCRFPEHLVADLEDLASQTLAAEANVPSSLSAPSFLRAGGLNVAFPDTMSWHWAQNDQALETFAAAARIAPRHILQFAMPL